MGTKRLEAYGDTIIVKRDSPETKVGEKGLIHLPDCAVEDSPTGVVVGVGPKAEGLSHNDRVLFPAFSGIEVTLENETFLLLKPQDILALVRTVTTE